MIAVRAQRYFSALGLNIVLIELNNVRMAVFAIGIVFAVVIRIMTIE